MFLFFGIFLDSQAVGFEARKTQLDDSAFDPPPNPPSFKTPPLEAESRANLRKELIKLHDGISYSPPGSLETLRTQSGYFLIWREYRQIKKPKPLFCLLARKIREFVSRFHAPEEGGFLSDRRLPVGQKRFSLSLQILCELCDSAVNQGL